MMVVVVGEGRMMRQLGVGQSGWAVQRMFAAQQQRNQGSSLFSERVDAKRMMNEDVELK
jgi:hypothetical protein